ncbi:hypothetical protein [Paraburkholderia strydomiana]|uniref:hypothetical protein n=1 Tax=Paraburkholderia strydomiana TaxID=1245417 RepID=UPI0038B6F98B
MQLSDMEQLKAFQKRLSDTRDYLRQFGGSSQLSSAPQKAIIFSVTLAIDDATEDVLLERLSPHELSVKIGRVERAADFAAKAIIELIGPENAID